MNFGEAIKSGFSNYVTFSGRAQRSAFWLWVFFAVLASIACSILDGAIFGFSEANKPISGLFGLATFLPGLAVTVRRLHDTGRSGWWILLWFIPLVGWIILIIWYCQPGEAGTNQYGPNPLGALQPA